MKGIFWVICLLLCVAYLVFYICYTYIILQRMRNVRAKNISVIKSNKPEVDVMNEVCSHEELESTPPISFDSNDLLTPLSAETTETLALAPGFVDIGCSSVIGTRAYQQDAVRTAMFGGKESGECQCAIGILCDGMGGMEGGEVASKVAVEKMLELVQSVVRDYPSFLRMAAERINQEVANLRSESGKKLNAGSTLTCAIVSENNLYWCAVGDSRVYLYREGQMKQLNIEHNYKNMVNEMIRTGQMRVDEVDTNEKPDALTSYLGMDKLRYIDGNTEPISLKEGDVILQCSDGLYRSLSDSELAQILQQLPDLQTAAEAMTSLAITIPGAHDNTSVILIRYKGAV